MKTIIVPVVLISFFLVAGCSKDISSEELASYFKKRTVDGNHPVALKKSSAVEAYLATIHGFPDNKTVCEEIIAPYNQNPEMSVMSGRYYCEAL